MQVHYGIFLVFIGLYLNHHQNKYNLIIKHYNLIKNTNRERKIVLILKKIHLSWKQITKSKMFTVYHRNRINWVGRDL